MKLLSTNIRLNATCHFCQQVNELSFRPISKTYSCMFCHQPNNNPFYMYEEGENDMDQPRDDKGRFIKVDLKKQIADYRAEVTEEKKRPSGKGFWEVDIDCVTECSKVQKTVEIHIKPLVKQKINYLMERFRSLEWLAYLLGSKETDNGQIHFIINDIHIPKQKISSGNVWDVECENYNELPIIGVIHSHHNMGASFSKTDHDFINDNHNISLLMSHNSMAAQVRLETPCGSVKIMNTTKDKDSVKIVHLVDDSVHNSFIEEINNNIINGNGQKKRKKKHGNKLTDAQRSYTNGVSVKDSAEQFSNWAGFTQCPNCLGMNVKGDKKCEFCHEEL